MSRNSRLPLAPARRRPTWALAGVVLATVATTSLVAAGLASGAQPSPATVANAISLRVSDLAALRPTTITLSHRTTEHTNPLLSNCAVGDASGANASLVVVQSYDVQTAPVQQETVASDVIVKSTPADAARDLAVYRTPAYMRCQAQVFAAGNRNGGTITAVRATPLAVTAPGSDGAFGWRQALTVRSKGFSTGTGSIVTDLRGFALGRYEVVLGVFGLGPGNALPFPASMEQRLIPSLLARALTQPH